MPAPTTILHLSDLQFGKNHLLGRLKLPFPDDKFDSLIERLKDDLDKLKESDGLQPDLIVVSGDLTEWGLPDEFANARRFLEALADHFSLTRDCVVIVPGNHDVNRKACEAYFNQCASDGVPPVEPFRAKWKHYAAMFDEFYEVLDSDKRPGFNIDEPWTLYRFDVRRIVVAGLNSTIAEIHDIPPTDTYGNSSPDHQAYIQSRRFGHFGYVGEEQLRWFAQRLQPLEPDWFRLGVVHHNLRRGVTDDDENLRDADQLDQWLNRQVNLWLHGHTHEGKKDHMPSGTLIFSTGSTALAKQARPDEVPCQFQFIRIDPDCVRQWTRKYDPPQRRWIADTRCSDDGNEWRVSHQVRFGAVLATPVLAPRRTLSCCVVSLLST